MNRILLRDKNATIVKTESGFQFRLGRFLLATYSTFEGAKENLDALNAIIAAMKEDAE